MRQYVEFLRGYRIYLDWDGNENEEECTEKKWSWKVVVPALVPPSYYMPALSEIELHTLASALLAGCYWIHPKLIMSISCQF